MATSKTPKSSSTKPKAAPKTLRSTTKAAIKKPSTPGVAKVKPKVAASPDNTLTKKELIERIVAVSGMKKGQVRTAVDATLTVLGETIREGKDIAAAPLGKIKIARKKDTPNGQLAILRVKLKDPEPKGDKDPLATAAE